MFLQNYLTYAAIDEAPQMWHLWAGFGTLSASMGRRVWLIQGSKCVYPNLYMLFVGNAAAGKNSAIAPCRDMLQALGDIPITYDVETVEGICRKIGGQPLATPPKVSSCLRPRLDVEGKLVDTHEACLMANEFTDLIRIAPEAWTVFLNNIFDCQTYRYGTKNSGEDILTNPYITIIAGLTTGQAHKLQKVDVINSGFARRALMQFGRRAFDNPIPFPKFGEEQKAAKEKCLAHLAELRKLSGEIKLTSEAYRWYVSWYCEHGKTLYRRATAATEGYLGSKSLQLQKLAMLASLGRATDMMIIPEDFEVALGYLDEMEKGFSFIFGSMGRNELSAVAVQITELLRATRQPFTEQGLMSKFYTQLTGGKSKMELFEVLQFLVDSGEIIKATLRIDNVQAIVWAIDSQAVEEFSAARRGASTPPIA